MLKYVSERDCLYSFGEWKGSQPGVDKDEFPQGKGIQSDAHRFGERGRRTAFEFESEALLAAHDQEI